MLKTLCVVVSDHGEAPKTEGESKVLREPAEGAGKGAREVVVTGQAEFLEGIHQDELVHTVFEIGRV